MCKFRIICFLFFSHQNHYSVHLFFRECPFSLPFQCLLDAYQWLTTSEQGSFCGVNCCSVLLWAGNISTRIWRVIVEHWAWQARVSLVVMIDKLTWWALLTPNSKDHRDRFSARLKTSEVQIYTREHVRIQLCIISRAVNRQENMRCALSEFQLIWPLVKDIQIPLPLRRPIDVIYNS